jgi:hypothetical protein
MKEEGCRRWANYVFITPGLNLASIISSRPPSRALLVASCEAHALPGDSRADRSAARDRMALTAIT